MLAVLSPSRLGHLVKVDASSMSWMDGPPLREHTHCARACARAGPALCGVGRVVRVPDSALCVCGLSVSCAQRRHLLVQGKGAILHRVAPLGVVKDPALCVVCVFCLRHARRMRNCSR